MLMQLNLKSSMCLDNYYQKGISVNAPLLAMHELCHPPTRL
jgi:hypothetical protein